MDARRREYGRPPWGREPFIPESERAPWGRCRTCPAALTEGAARDGGVCDSCEEQDRRHEARFGGKGDGKGGGKGAPGREWQSSSPSSSSSPYPSAPPPAPTGRRVPEARFSAGCGCLACEGGSSWRCPAAQELAAHWRAHPWPTGGSSDEEGTAGKGGKGEKGLGAKGGGSSDEEGRARKGSKGEKGPSSSSSSSSFSSSSLSSSSRHEREEFDRVERRQRQAFARSLAEGLFVEASSSSSSSSSSSDAASMAHPTDAAAPSPDAAAAAADMRAAVPRVVENYWRNYELRSLEERRRVVGSRNFFQLPPPLFQPPPRLCRRFFQRLSENSGRMSYEELLRRHVQCEQDIETAVQDLNEALRILRGIDNEGAAGGAEEPKAKPKPAPPAQSRCGHCGYLILPSETIAFCADCGGMFHGRPARCLDNHQSGYCPGRRDTVAEWQKDE